MPEETGAADERRLAAQILREHMTEVVDRWSRKIRLLADEKSGEDPSAARSLGDDVREFLDLLVSRLEGHRPEGDVAAFYHLILHGRQHAVKLADVAYVLLELKNVSKQIIFEDLGDELDAFRVSRVVDDAVEAILRKSADLYELASEADHISSQERLQEIFAAWDLEEALGDAQSLGEVCRVAAEQLGQVWDLGGCWIRFGDAAEGTMRDLTDRPGLPVPQVRERRQYLTDQELAAGGVLSMLAQVTRRRESAIYSDVMHDGRLVNGPELAEGRLLSLACSPLLLRDRVAGAVLLYGRSAGAFGESDRRRLEDFAGVLAMALDRTGRMEQSRREMSEAEVIARIGRSLLELPTREALLQGVAEALRSFRDYFDVSLFRVAQDAAECVLVAEAGRGRRYRPDEYRQSIDEGFIGYCARTGETVRAADLDADERRLVAFEEEYRARSELAVPVKRGERVIGVMHFLSERENDFPDSEIAALEHVSPHIGVALQNASMIVERRHDRFEIEQAHRQLSNIIRSAAVGITSTDTEGLFTHWSQACEEMLGYGEHEVVDHMTPADLYAEPHDLRQGLEECLLEGRTEVERPMVRKDGAVRIIRETCVPVGDERGEHEGFTAYLVDVTEQKLAEEQLRRERDTLNSVVDAMGAGLAMFDQDLAVQWANSTMMQWFNFGPEDFGRECHDICTANYCQTDTCPILQATTTGRPQTRVNEVVDENGVWRCYQQVFTPVTFGEARLVALTFDITEQRRQTEQMRLINKLAQKVETTLDLEKVLQLVLTSVTAGHAIGLNRAFIFLLDGEGRALEGRMAVGPVSPADADRIWRDMDQRGQSIDELLDGAFLAESDSRLTEVMVGLRVPLSNRRDPLVSTLRSRTTAYAGDARTDPHMDRALTERLGLEEFICVPLVAQDQPLGVMLADNKYTGATVDQDQVELLEQFSRQASLAIANAYAYEKIRDQLDQLQQARAELIEAERMASVGRMASHLAHEIRNPLTAIGGFAASIARSHADDPRTHRNASIIYDEVRRLEKTLVNALDYTRPLRPVRKPVRMDEVVRETVEQFAGQFRQEGVTVKLSVDEGVPEVSADRQMIKQVMVNLVKNALEAMEGRPNSTVSIALSAADGEVQLVVADNGAGMEQSTIDALFSPFFTTKIGGIGLGLSISRRIVEQHGGRIEVDSELGSGTTFTVALGAAIAGRPQESGASRLGTPS